MNKSMQRTKDSRNTGTQVTRSHNVDMSHLKQSKEEIEADFIKQIEALDSDENPALGGN